MRDILYDESLVWQAGYNIYHSKNSQFRYVYGYSYESDLRNTDVSIIAQSMVGKYATIAVTLLAAGISLIF